MDDKSIACELEEEISVISRITSVARKMEPDYDVEKIYSELVRS